MNALYFDGVPADWESLKSQNPSNLTLMGAKLFGAEVFKALLKYGHYQQLLLPRSPRAATGDLRDSDLFVRNQHRIEHVAEHELEKLNSFPEAVFMTPGIDLADMARLRRLSGHHLAPVTGLIHSINYTRHLRFILLLLLSPLTRFDALICSSRAGRSAMLSFLELIRSRLDGAGLPPLKARFQMPLIPLGIEPGDFVPVDGIDLTEKLSLQAKSVVLYFGRFSATSKADLFPPLIALEEVSRTVPNVALILAGDDTHYNMARDLRCFAQHVCPHVRVEVIANPDISTKKTLFSIASIFIAPSDNLQETFGISIIEAMAAGLPIVASDWDGYKDLIVEGETGYRIRTMLPRYPPAFDDIRGSGDMRVPDLLASSTMVDVRQLAECVERVLADPGKRRAMGEAARKRACNLYAWSVVIKQYEDLWKHLLCEAKQSSAAAPEAALDLDTFSYQEIFSHYPTAFLEENSMVRLSEIGRTWIHGYDLLAKTPGADGWFQSATFQTIVTFLRGMPDAPVRNVLDAIRNHEPLSDVFAIAHVCRLIKYGLVEEVM